MSYSINPPNQEALRALASQRLGAHSTPDTSQLSAAEIQQAMEELAISKLELEIQTEYLNDARTQLDASLNQFRELFDFAPVGMLNIDSTGCISKINLQAASLLGQERARLLGQQFEAFLVPSERPGLRALLTQTLASGEVQRSTLAIQGVGDNLKHVQLDMTTLAPGEGCYLVLSDITAEVKRENKLRMDCACWKFALDATSDGVWDWDVQANTVHFSCKLTQLYGFTQGEFGSQLDDWRQRIHPDDQAGLLSNIQQCLQGRSEGFFHAHRVLCKDGTWKPVYSQGSVFAHTAEGAVARIIGTHTDLKRFSHLSGQQSG